VSAHWKEDMQLKSEIRNFIAENFLYGQNDGLGDDVSFLQKGLIDSTGVLELVAFVEEKYEISVADEELIPDNFDSINKLSDYIIDKLNKLNS
jgi:acyl carrier protein